MTRSAAPLAGRADEEEEEEDEVAREASAPRIPLSLEPRAALRWGSVLSMISTSAGLMASDPADAAAADEEDEEEDEEVLWEGTPDDPAPDPARRSFGARPGV
jgi:hypothetical protein